MVQPSRAVNWRERSRLRYEGQDRRTPLRPYPDPEKPPEPDRQYFPLNQRYQYQVL